MPVRRQYQYQALAIGLAPIVAAAVVNFVASEIPQVSSKTFLYQSIADPVSGFPPTVPVVGDVITSEQPVISRKTLLYQSIADPVPIPAAEVITADKWFNPLSEPIVKQKLGLRTGEQQTTTFDTKPTVSFSWFAPLPEPVRQKYGLPAAKQQFAVLPPRPTVPFGWFGALSDPAKPKAGLRTSSQQALAFTATVPEVISLDKWFEPLSDPARIKRGLNAALQQTTVSDPTTPVRASTAAVFSTDVVFPRTVLYPSFAASPPPNPTVSFSWFNRLSEPVRVKRLPVAEQQFTTIGTQPAVPFGWASALSEPRRVVPLRDRSATTFVQAPSEVITADKWFEPLSEPTRVKAGLEASLQRAALIDPFPIPAAPPTVTWAEGEGAQLSRKTLLYQSIAEPVQFTVEIVTADKWHQQLSEPVRKKPDFRVRPQVATVVVPAPVVVVGDVISVEETSFSRKTLLYQSIAEPVEFILPVRAGWQQPWSEPVRKKPDFGVRPQVATVVGEVPAVVVLVDFVETEGTQISRKTLLYQSIAEPVQFHIPVQVQGGWQQPWSEPLRAKPTFRVKPQVATVVGEIPVPVTTVDFVESWGEQLSSKTLLYQSVAEVVTQPEAVTESRWHQPWSEPVRVKQGLRAQFQPFLLQSNPLPRVSFSWFEPLSDPVRVKPAVRAGLQQALTLQPKPTVPLPPHVWSEPVRVKPALRAGLQQAFAPSPAPVVPFPPHVWSEPVRVKARLVTGAQQAFWFHPTPVVPLPPHAWSEPVRVKPGLRAGLQHSIEQVLVPGTFSPQVYWHIPFAEPVRFKPGLHASRQQFFATDTLVRPPITLGNWFKPFNEPVRQKAGLGARFQRFEELDPFARPQAFTTGWLREQNEPVRLKPGLRASLQQAFTIDPWILTQPETVTESRWHQAWSEPVRLKIGLRPWYQQFLAYAQSGKDYIVVVLDTTETPDVFSGVITVQASVNSAIVSISEVVPEYAIVSSVYVEPIYATVSIEEIGTDFAQASSIEEPIVFAYVSIIEV